MGTPSEEQLHKLMVTDIYQGLISIHVWNYLGLHDIRQRYRRSVLGPFWFTLTTAIFVTFIGILYSTLFKQELSSYLPHLAVGIVVWQYIATVSNEGCTVFTDSGHLIKQVNLPLTVHVMREVWRNFIIMLHSFPVIIFVLIVFKSSINVSIIALPFGLMAIMFFGLLMGIILGVLGTRFRDIPPIVANLVQVAFFFTPIIWVPELLKGRAWVAGFNPMFHLVEVVRAPMLGKGIPVVSFIWVFALLVLGFFLAQLLMKRYGHRVPYWL
jgi:lipopolysaccharide transport system permease protein